MVWELQKNQNGETKSLSVDRFVCSSRNKFDVMSLDVLYFCSPLDKMIKIKIRLQFSVSKVTLWDRNHRKISENFSQLKV